MSRTAAKFTQADIARAIRAAKQAGGGHVELKADGTIVVKLVPDDTKIEPAADEPEIVL
jgi:hypothetical protein